jgi:DCN1-like protein 4/5
MVQKRRAPERLTKCKKKKISSTKSVITEDNQVKHDKSFSEKKCRAWFNQYCKQDDPEEIGPEGIESFCFDLNIGLESKEILIIAYFMDALQMGYFEYDEWIKGMKKMGTDTLDKLKQKLPELENYLLDPVFFKNLYKYAYNFARIDNQKYIDLEVAIGLWNILLNEENCPIINSFIEFLHIKQTVKVINKDQWSNFLEFSHNIPSDLNTYDEAGAWPVLFDEYILYLKEYQQHI